MSLSGIMPVPCKEIGLILLEDRNENHLDVNHNALSLTGSKHQLSLTSVAVWSSEDFNHGYSGYQPSPRTTGSSKAGNSLSDLCGDYDSHLSSLNHGRWWYEHALNAPYSPVSPQWVSQFQGKNSWDLIQQSLPFRQNFIPQMNANGVVRPPLFYPMNSQILPGAANYGMEDTTKPRGTGTYFPSPSHYRDRPLNVRGRNQAPVRSPSNGHVMTHPETNFPERSSTEPAVTPVLAPAHIHVYQGGANTGLSDVYHSSSPEKKAQSNANGSVRTLQWVVEFGSVVHLSYVPPSVESGRQPNTISTVGQNPIASLSSPRTPKPKRALGLDQDRIASYHMKDEDFPPLSA